MEHLLYVEHVDPKDPKNWSAWVKCPYDEGIDDKGWFLPHKERHECTSIFVEGDTETLGPCEINFLIETEGIDSLIPYVWPKHCRIMDRFLLS